MNKTASVLLIACLSFSVYAKPSVGIFSATASEFTVLKDHFAGNLGEAQKISNFTYYQTTFSSSDIQYLIVRCGIGKVNAALCVNTAIENFALDEVIFVGLAGSLQEYLKYEDVLIVEKSCQYDFDLSSFDGKKAKIPNWDSEFFYSSSKLIKKYKQRLEDQGINNLHVGTIATGDTVTQNDLQRQEKRDICSADAADMETAGAAQAANYADVDFIGIRVISNRAGDGGHSEYADMTKNNMKHLAAVIAAITP